MCHVALGLLAASIAVAIASRPPAPQTISDTGAQCRDADLVDYYWEHNDWGVLQRYKRDIREYCAHSLDGGDPAPATSLKCSSSMEYCEARNIWATAGSLEEHSANRNLVAKVGALGDCRLDAAYPPRAKGLFSLTDWVPELSPFKDSSHPAPSCDVRISAPVHATVGDSWANFYHKMCDFPNLFSSMYIAGLQDEPTDKLRVMYWEPSMFYQGATFNAVHKIFTTHPLLNFTALYGKTICFDHIVFAIKPRNLQTFFFNQYIPRGCIAGPNSFMPRFAQAAVTAVLGDSVQLDRMAAHDKIRVTLLSRSSGSSTTTGTRHLLNEAALLDAARSKFPEVSITLAKFDWNDKVPFVDQVNITGHTDILIGVHGAGLAHMIFLPIWGTVIELYNAEDPGCYRDLAKLCGLHYVTGSSQDVVRVAPQVERQSQEPKFWNFEFNEGAFMRYMSQAINHVKRHPLSPIVAGNRSDL